MTRSTILLCPILLLLASTAALGDDSAALSDGLVAAKLPDGYQAAAQELKDGGKTVGNLIIVSDPKKVSKVVVQTELRDLSAVAARRAATKAYVNTLASTLAGAGFKLVKKDIPDIGKASFDKPISVDLEFANAAGKKLWTFQSIFFTDKGFDVQVIADSADALAGLKDWAKTVKPKP